MKKRSKAEMAEYQRKRRKSAPQDKPQSTNTVTPDVTPAQKQVVTPENVTPDIVTPSKSVTPCNTLSVTPSNPLVDKLVPGNKNIYQRLDNSRYIIDAEGKQHEFGSGHRPISENYLPDAILAQIEIDHSYCVQHNIPDNKQLRISRARHYQGV